MEHHFSTTMWIEEDIRQLFRERQLKKVGRKGTRYLSLRAAFKHLRKQPKYSLLGDYSIMYTISRSLNDLQSPTTKENVYSAMKYSKEFKGPFPGKAELVRQVVAA